MLELRTVTSASGDLEVAADTADWVKLLDLFIGSVPIIAPFLDVAVHVMQAPRVRRCGAYLQRDRLGLPGLLLVLVVRLRQFIAGTVGSGSAGSARVFPLALGRQGIWFPLFFGEPPENLNR